MVVSYVDQKIETPGLELAPRKRRPPPEKWEPRPLQDFETVVKRNIFNPNAPEESLVDAIKATGLGLDEAGAVPSALPYDIVGTIILTDPSRSVVALKDKAKNETESYQPGDVVDNKAKVFKVDSFKVYFQNLQTQRLEYLELKDDTEIASARGFEPGAPSMPTEGGIRETSPGRFIVDRAYLESSLSNPNDILTQARAVPNLVGGKIMGFRIFAIRPGSVYQKLGIQNGDVILRINGVDLDSPAKALEFYGAISSAAEVAIDLERSGQKISMNYTIK